MGISKLVEKIQEETVGGDISGAVSNNGNPSIAYLPGGFTNIKNSLLSLSLVKKQWGIETIENNENINVNFEDALTISIPKQSFKEFNDKVLNIENKNKVDLINILNEAKSSQVHNLYSRLNRLITVNLRENPAIRKTLIASNYWLSLFPNSIYLSMEGNTLLRLNTFDADARLLLQRIKDIYEDDIGNLEMIATTIKEKRPLNAFEPFSEYDYLAGVRIQSKYEGNILILELTVSNALVQTQSLYIENKEILNELKNSRQVKILNNLVYPVGQVFAPSFFLKLKRIIDELEEEE